MDWNGNVEHTSKANQVDRYLQTETVEEDIASSETVHILNADVAV
jgi:hypothetical protein